MKAAFVVTWSTPFPGREKKAIEFFREFNEFFVRLAADGKCTEPEWFVAAHTNYWFVKAEYETLTELLVTPEIRRFIMLGGYLFQEFDYDVAFVGTEDFILDYEKIGVELGYV